MRVQLSIAILAIGIFSAIGIESAWGQAQSAQPAPQGQSAQPAQPAGVKQPQYKDRAEYDLVQAIIKETDPKKETRSLESVEGEVP